MSVRTLKSFSAYVPDASGTQTFRAFRQGETISDPVIARALVEFQCPMVSVEDQRFGCPFCGSAVHREHDAVTLTVVQATCGVPIDRQFVSLRCGDVVKPQYLEAFRAAQVPLAETRGWACPNCGYLFY